MSHQSEDHPPSYTQSVSSVPGSPAGRPFERMMEALTVRSAAVTTWAEQVEAEAEVGLQQEINVSGTSLKLTRLDYGMARDSVPPQERLQQQRGLRSTTLLRTSGTRQIVPCSTVEISRVCAAVPYGPGVRSLGWTKAEQKASPAVLDTVASMLTRGLKSGLSRTTLPHGTRVTLSEWPEQNLYHTEAGYTWWSLVLVGESENIMRVMLHMDGLTMLDIAGGQELLDARAEDSSLHSDLLILLAGIQHAILADELAASYHLLQDASLAGMRQHVAVTSTQATDQGGYTGGGPHHALWSEGEYLSDDLVQDRRVPTAYYDANFDLTAYGLASAGDLPPTPLVVLGTNGGKAVTGSVLVIRNASSDGGFFLAVTSATANAKPYALEKSTKLGATVRDGLFSPACVGALCSRASGFVGVVVNGEYIALQTVLANLTVGEPIVVHDRDPYRLYEYVWDLCGVMGWHVKAADGYMMDVYSGQTQLGTVAVRYGACVGPRWMRLLAPCALETRKSRWSPELILDYGASGLGRYLLREYIVAGRFAGFKNLMMHTDGYFAEAAKSIAAPLPNAPAAKLPVSYVIDTEYLTRKLPDGTLERYVYALGLAKFYAGNYVGSALVVDQSPELDQFIEDNGHLAGSRPMRMLLDLKEEIGPRASLCSGNPSALLAELRIAARSPEVRLYAKGADVEKELLSSKLTRATRLFRRAPVAEKIPLHELGAMVPRYEELARKYDWDTSHNPAKECVLFGVEAGLGASVPIENAVGLDDMYILLPQMATQVV
uniref:Uncharacterized protein n=1 Tax=Alternaria alternata chrysovirus 1 TaxID=2066695 RepID=A0A858Z2J6_9VIRU|nr:hypothetical protein [Alternaria alternata chrysovirus 1]